MYLKSILRNIKKNKIFIFICVLGFGSCQSTHDFNIEGTWGLSVDNISKPLPHPFNTMFIKSDIKPYSKEFLYFNNGYVEYPFGFFDIYHSDGTFIYENFISYKINNDTITFLVKEKSIALPIEIKNNKICIDKSFCLTKYPNKEKKHISSIDYVIKYSGDLSLDIHFDLVKNICHINKSSLSDSLSINLNTLHSNYLQIVASRINKEDLNKSYNQGFTDGRVYDIKITIDDETFFFSSIGFDGYLPFELAALIITMRKISSEIFFQMKF